METQNQMFEEEKYEALHGLDTTTEEQDEEKAKSE